MHETPLPIFKVFSTKIPAYIYDFISLVRQSQRHPNTFNSFSLRNEYFINTFFPCVIGEWNKLNPAIRSSGSYNVFRKSLLNFIRPRESKVYNIDDTIVIKLISRLGLGFGQLREHKFKHDFQDTLNRRCHFFDALRATLMNDLKNIDNELPSLRHRSQNDNKTNNFNARNTIY